MPFQLQYIRKRRPLEFEITFKQWEQSAMHTDTVRRSHVTHSWA